MKYPFSQLATEENQWYALIFVALGLAIVIIDNTVLNVSIPYILRDLNAPFSSIQWVISGYSLTIATFLVTVGRFADVFGRKLIFLIGIGVFAVGSFIGSIAHAPLTLIFGRSIIQATGAAMILTSALSLVSANFKGRERAIAFGIWGSIAGASASIGPLLGGYLTTYYSWRWSLRINLIVSGITLLGSVLIRESKGEGERRFDWWGMILSGAGLALLVFALIEGNTYGWLRPKKPASAFGLSWPLNSVSIIPFIFILGAIFVTAFILRERRLERAGREPLLKMSLFRNRAFTVGLLTLLILTLGQFGLFFSLPIYFENVLGYDALQTGVVFQWTSVTLLIFGVTSGFLASRFNIKLIVIAGMIVLSGGTFFLSTLITPGATSLSLAPALIVFGAGFGLSTSQMNNIILSSAPDRLAGSASGASATMRQVGGSIGVAVLGSLLASMIIANLVSAVNTNSVIPNQYKEVIISDLKHVDVESGSISIGSSLPPQITNVLKEDVADSISSATQSVIRISFYLALFGTIVSFFLVIDPRNLRFTG
jgi:EmrB/QacA subfamily drug resistance transporter